MPKTYTVKEVAEILGFSTNSIYAFLKEKRIQGVRVGKGRFRIPEEELARILHLSKKAGAQPTQKISTSQVLYPESVIAPTGQEVMPPSDQTVVSERIGRILGTWQGELNLFDWFIAGLGMLIAAAIVLVPTMVGRIYGTPYGTWLFPICVSFGLGGVGLITIGFLSLTHTLRYWRMVFCMILGATFVGFAAVQWFTGDMVSGLVFGSIAVAILISTAVQLSEIASLITVGFSVAIITPIIVDLFPQTDWVPMLHQSNPMVQLGTLGVWEVVWALAFIAVWQLANRGRFMISALLSAIMASGFVAFAIYHAQNFHIVQALLMEITAIFLIILPFWKSIQAGNKRGKLLSFAAYGMIIALCIVAIGTLRIIQTSLATSASGQLTDRLSYAQDEVSGIVGDTKRALESLTSNPKLVTSITEKDDTTIQALLRSIFEGSRAIRRVLVIDPSGKLLHFYPDGTGVAGGTYAYRDYFIQAVNRKDTFISDVFYENSQDKRSVIAISTPVYTKTHTLAAVLVGSIDIDAVQLELDKIASSEMHELFAVADRSNRWVLHQDASRAMSELTTIEKEQAVQPQNSVKEWINPVGDKLLVAHTSIPETQWTLYLQASEIDVFRKSTMVPAILSGAFILACIVVCMSIVIYSGLWWMEERKQHHIFGGGP